MEFRKEKDTMGIVDVPANVYWGAQTQRSIENFKIAEDINKMRKINVTLSGRCVMKFWEVN